MPISVGGGVRERGPENTNHAARQRESFNGTTRCHQIKGGNTAR
jgi:hypothetical protein